MKKTLSRADNLCVFAVGDLPPKLLVEIPKVLRHSPDVRFASCAPCSFAFSQEEREALQKESAWFITTALKKSGKVLLFMAAEDWPAVVALDLSQRHQGAYLLIYGKLPTHVERIKQIASCFTVVVEIEIGCADDMFSNHLCSALQFLSVNEPPFKLNTRTL